MKEDIMNRGKDWWEFRKGMGEFIVQTHNMRKRKAKTKTRALPNNTMPAPHSVGKIGIMTRV
jgi:hypothetical protein